MKTRTPLTRRLMVAGLLAVALITLILVPIAWLNKEARFEQSRLTAQALLDAEHEALMQGLNESLNHALAISQFPTVRQHLSRAHQTQSPYQDDWSKRNADNLKSAFGILLTHFNRYTRVALLDSEGQLQLSTESSLSYGEQLANEPYFQRAKTLDVGSLYISAPYLGQSDLDTGETLYQLDIATPVINAEGQRLGILVLTLNWNYLLSTLPHAMGTHEYASAWLIDGQGRWLVPSSQGALAFGDSLQQKHMEVWSTVEAKPEGAVLTDDQLIVFRTHDIGMQHFSSAANQVISESGNERWRIGIGVTRPDVSMLVAEGRRKLSLVVIMYGLAIGFSVFWVLSNHRQRSLKEKAQRLTQSARDYAQELTDLYENAPCGYHSLDELGVIHKINRTELQWLGYSRDELVGKRCYRDLVTPETRDAFDEAFKAVLGDGHEGSAEVELMRKNGERLPVAIEATAQTNANGFQYSRAMVFDLTERKQLEDLLTRQAMTDPLTGLGNRRFLETQAELEIPRARRSAELLTLIAVDLDRFKRINDEYGHDVGDRVLQEFAKTAQAELRDGDILCRMGGEEFTVLLPNTSKEDALMVAERLRTAVEANPAEVGTSATEDGYLPYTVSLGVTLVLPDESSLKPAIKRADQALYAAKETGRNRVSWQSP